MLRLRVRYGRIADFLADASQQLAHGGLLVRVAVEGTPRGAPVELTIATPIGEQVVTGQVLQLLAGAGVAVGFDAALVADLVARARAQAAGTEEGEPPVHELAPPPGVAPVAATPTAAHSHGAEQAAKIQQALHGDKNQRAAILRENNKLLHTYVLRNPQIGLDEVAAVARMSTVSPDVLVFIAGRREWYERADVAIALVRNPKTPVPLAIRLLDHVGVGELRLLAKQPTVREAIARAARKKILG